MNKNRQELKQEQGLELDLIPLVRHFGAILEVVVVVVVEQLRDKQALKIFSKSSNRFSQWEIKLKEQQLKEK